MESLILKFRLVKGKCSECSCKIPNSDLSNSIAGKQLICKKCRNEGHYEGRCPICNGGKRMSIEYRDYTFEEIQDMHDKCFLFLLNDYKYQYQFHPDYTIEKRNLICASCKHYILRENAGCPRCKEKRNSYMLKLEELANRT